MIIVQQPRPCGIYTHQQRGRDYSSYYWSGGTRPTHQKTAHAIMELQGKISIIPSATRSCDQPAFILRAITVVSQKYAHPQKYTHPPFLLQVTAKGHLLLESTPTQQAKTIYIR